MAVKVGLFLLYAAERCGRVDAEERATKASISDCAIFEIVS
jgi:hypothetical protein